MTLDWDAEALRQALTPILPGLQVTVVAECESTSTTLLARCRGGATGPALLVAERQTAGRGRQGRRWDAARGDSLTFSLCWPMAPLAGWSGLSLVAGLAVAEALDPGGAALAVKWPNDVLQRTDDGLGRKMAGILVETVGLGEAPASAPSMRAVVLGVGVNIRPVAPASTDVDEQALPRAAWQDLAPDASAPRALHAIAPRLLAALGRFEREGLAPFLPAFEARDVLRGRSVQAHAGRRADDRLLGVAVGIDADGALRVQTAAGLQRVLGGEVSVREARSA